jgi:hypothetical protein
VSIITGLDTVEKRKFVSLPGLEPVAFDKPTALSRLNKEEVRGRKHVIYHHENYDDRHHHHWLDSPVCAPAYLGFRGKSFFWVGL